MMHDFAKRVFFAVLPMVTAAVFFTSLTEAGTKTFEQVDSDIKIDAGAIDVTYPQRGRTVEIDHPGELDQSDTEYRLVRDIEADGTAFTIEAPKTTLNLNGHTVTYMNKGQQREAYGVYVGTAYMRPESGGIAIVNGKIIQGNGNCSGQDNASGCNPVYSPSVNNIEIAGLTILYHTSDTSGILFKYAIDLNIHHNTITDEGTQVTNRHQGVAVIENRGDGSRHFVHHNYIRGARQNGIRVGTESEVFSNEVRVESRVTNSAGISVAGGAIHDNKIIGRGVHPIGIWPGNDIKVYGNYVEVQSTRTGEEYGETGAACLRMTWGNNNVEVIGNTFILYAEENYQGSGFNSWGRCLWIGLPKADQHAEFHDNLIVAKNTDGKAKAAAVAIVCSNESPNLVFRNNRIVSNWSNVLLADRYGHAGGYARFVDNTFVRDGSYDSYRTFRSQYSERPSTAVLINNNYEQGASPESMDLEFAGGGKKELAFGWHLDIAVIDEGKAVEGALVTIFDSDGMTVFQGKTDSNGKVSCELTSWLLTNQGGIVGEGRAADHSASGNKVARTPHTVVVEKNGRIAGQQVYLDANKAIVLPL